MQKPVRNGILGGLGVLGVVFLVLALQPDRSMSFSRVVPSKYSAEKLGRSMFTPARWPQWFHHLDAVRMNTPELQTGTLLTLQMDPQKGTKKRYTLTAEVTHYVPNQEIQLRILSDSSLRLTQLFETLDWSFRIESRNLDPNPPGSLLTGTATVRTKSWRARLIGSFASRVLLNQVYSPNLLKLSEQETPFTIEPSFSQSGNKNGYL
jgi:hypothetical protein